MQILKEGSFAKDVLRGWGVRTQDFSAAQAQAGATSSSDSFELQQATRPQQEVGEWMNWIKQAGSSSSFPANVSDKPGVITVENARVEAGDIPHFSGLENDPKAMVQVSGTLDSSPETLQQHHGVPQFHLVTSGDKGQLNNLEYWHSDATDGGLFGLGAKHVGTLDRTEVANHDTLVSETVVHPDQSVSGSVSYMTLS